MLLSEMGEYCFFSLILQLGFEFLFILPSHFGVGRELVWDSERCDNLKQKISQFDDITIAALKRVILKCLGENKPLFFHCTQGVLYVNTA